MFFVSAASRVELRFTAGLSAGAIIRDPDSLPSIGDLEENVTPLIRLASLMNMERRGHRTVRRRCCP